MRSVEKSAKTYEEAVSAALAELNASISDVDIQVLEEGSKGLFGLFGSRPTRIRVTMKEVEEEEDLLSLVMDKKPEPKPAPKPAPTPKPAPVADEKPAPAKPAPAPEAKPAPKRPEPVRRVNPAAQAAEKKPAPEAAEAAQAPAEAPQKPAKPPRARQPKPKQPKADKPKAEEKPQEKKPLPPKAPAKPLEKPVITMIPDEEVVPDSAAGKAQAFLKELTHLMGVDVTVAVGNDAEGNVFAQMTGDTLGVLIGRRGETLDALQYLTSLKINRGQEGYTRVTLDTENYRAKREDTLTRLANRMANRAVKTGRKVSLEPMNPYERRIIHSALQLNDAVDTHSEGEEPNRHVVITLRK